MKILSRPVQLSPQTDEESTIVEREDLWYNAIGALRHYTTNLWYVRYAAMLDPIHSTQMRSQNIGIHYGRETHSAVETKRDGRA